MTMGITSPTSTTGQILKDGTAVISFDANNNATFAGTVVSNTPLGMRNRIINGDMRIDQRNAGASVASPSDTYTLDRFYSRQVGGGVASIQQSSTAPTGFNNSLLFTVTTADSSIVTTDRYYIRQSIEGYNVADLGWGTASAQTITLSFWVRSSVTGTFGGSLQNDAVDRTYAFTYSISSANTWEQKTVTIAGDTSGTWLKTNGVGLIVQWSLGMGPTYLTTAGSWTAGNYLSATGSTNLIATNGATFYITGVQLEIGTSATPFERRLYNQELANCQRYYQTYAQPALRGVVVSASAINRAAMSLPVTMRVAPTGTMVGNLPCYDGVTAGTVSSLSATYSTASVIEYDLSTNGGLTAYRPGLIYQSGSSSNYLTLSAEL